MARLSLAPSPLLQPTAPAAPPPPQQVALWCDDPDAALPWQEALAAEGVAVRSPEARPGNAAPEAWLLHVNHGLAAQLARLRDLRAAWPTTPLVVACRQLRDLDHVLALEMGADDALDTALAAPVVAARLRALWRRSSRTAAVEPAPAHELRFGALEISLTARCVVLAGTPVTLTEGEFEVLWLLAVHAGQTLSRRDILRSVRGLDDHPTDRSIDSRVYRIRAKLGDDAAGHPRIRTVRHRGYVFSPQDW